MRKTTMETSIITTYLMDPEQLFEFAVVPRDFPRDGYDEVWEFFLSNCYQKIDKDEVDRVRAEIKARQNGWCSIANLRDAGFAVNMAGVVGRLVPQDVVKRVCERHLYCAAPDLTIRDAW